MKERKKERKKERGTRKKERKWECHNPNMINCYSKKEGNEISQSLGGPAMLH